MIRSESAFEDLEVPLLLDRVGEVTFENTEINQRGSKETHEGTRPIQNSLTRCHFTICTQTVHNGPRQTTGDII